MSSDITRRSLLSGLVGAGTLSVLTACSGGSDTASTADSLPPAAPVPSTSTTGRTRSFQLRARPAQVDLGGRVVNTWTYGTTLPGKVLRATAGDRVKVAFANDLPVGTSVHWHGLAIRNAMDGVPGVTTPPVPAGGHFPFDFVVPYAGTHWFHPHTGLQLDRGLYAPFIIDDPHEPGGYDHEWILVLDDWTDGVGKSPEQIFADLRAGTSNRSTGSTGMGGMTMGASGGMGGGAMTGDGGDVTYPLYLINGRSRADPDVLTAKKGQRVRLRIINAAAATIFDLAIAGHTLHVTHSDGYPVRPVVTSALRIGMGGRYDATITLGDGVFPLIAQPVGKSGTARALLRTGAGAVPAADATPAELNAQPLTVAALNADPGAALARRTPSSTQDLRLAGSMSNYIWTINGRTYDNTVPLTAHLGRTTRLRIQNMSMMSHPSTSTDTRSRSGRPEAPGHARTRFSSRRCRQPRSTCSPTTPGNG